MTVEDFEVEKAYPAVIGAVDRLAYKWSKLSDDVQPDARLSRSLSVRRKAGGSDARRNRGNLLVL
jgi:hypothetical protein